MTDEPNQDSAGAEAPTKGSGEPPTLVVVAVSLWFLSYGGFCFFLLIVVPRFKEIFANMGVSLPFVTQLVLNMSDWITNNWFVGLPLLAAVAAAGLLAPLKWLDAERLKKPIAAAYFACAGMMLLAIPAIWLPIVELQRALQQD